MDLLVISDARVTKLSVTSQFSSGLAYEQHLISSTVGHPLLEARADSQDTFRTCSSSRLPGATAQCLLLTLPQSPSLLMAGCPLSMCVILVVIASSVML